MRSAIPYLIQGSNVVLMIDNQAQTISKETHVSFAKIMEAIKAKDWDTVAELVDTRKAIVKFGAGNVTIDNDVVYWKGAEFHNALAERMIRMFSEGFPVEPMVAFMERLMKNPSMRSVKQLYGFLEKNSLPITEDGYFLAYKKVKSNYCDIHTGTISNHVGAVVEMDRNLVDDNPDSHCSAGLHFCSISYLDSFGGRGDPIMILKIDPADVVSIPSDHNGAKGRCTKYEVIAEVAGDPANAFSNIVDRKYSKTAPISAPWPFPETPVTNHSQILTAPFSTTYKIVRVFGGAVEYYENDLARARRHVARHASGKKAKLKIVDKNGNEVK